MEPGNTSSQPGLARCGEKIKLTALITSMNFDKKEENVNETFKLLTLKSRSGNADNEIYNPDIGTRRKFVKDVPLRHDEKILTAYGKKVLLLEKSSKRLSIWNLQDGQRFYLPTIPDADLGPEVKAAVVCAGSENRIRIVLLGTIDCYNTDPWNYNADEVDQVVVIWSLLDITEGWDVRLNNFKKMKNFNPRSVAIHGQKFWMVMDNGEILVSHDRQSAAPNFEKVPSLPNNFEAVQYSKNHNLYAEKPHLVCKGGSGPDYGFSGFIKHDGDLFLVTSSIVYKLQAAKDPQGADYHMFGQVKRIGGATFIVNEYSQGYGYISSRAENKDCVLIARSVMIPGKDKITDCVSYNVVSGELSAKLLCSTGDSCTREHCWIQ